MFGRAIHLGPLPYTLCGNLWRFLPVSFRPGRGQVFEPSGFGLWNMVSSWPCAGLLLPLTNALQGLLWSQPMEQAFNVAKSALAAAAKLKHPHTDLPISHMLEWSMPQTGSCWLSTPRSATSGSYWKRGSSSFSPTTNPSASQSNGMVEWMHQQLKAGFICI